MHQAAVTYIFSRVKSALWSGHIFVIISALAVLAACSGDSVLDNVPSEPGADGVAPRLIEVTIFNAQTLGSKASVGQRVRLEFEADESLMTPSVTIGGVEATLATGNARNWIFDRTMGATDADVDAIPFSISFSDPSGEVGVPVNNTTDGSSVRYCADGCPIVSEVDPLVGYWKLAPEAAAMAIGPSEGSTEWWSNGEADVAGSRACMFDDLVYFGADGSFSQTLGDETFLEAFQGGTENCGAPVYPHDGSSSATYTTEKSSSGATQTITLQGVGAHLGLPRIANGIDLAAPSDAPASITYNVSLLAEDGSRMVVTIESGSGWWQFVYVKQPMSPIVGHWKLAPTAGAMAIGPVAGSTEWWSNGEADVSGARACIFDDVYTFGADGTFTQSVGHETFLEPWQGAASEGCGTPISPHDGSASATWSEVAASGDTLGTVTIEGVGAHMGLARIANGLDLLAPVDAPASVTYDVALLSEDGNNLTLQIESGSGWWQFKFVKYQPSLLVGDWSLAPTAAALAIGPTAGSTEWWSNGEADVAGARACMFDDVVTFGIDGTFSQDLGDDTFLEAFQGGSENCGAAVAPHDGTALATWSEVRGSGDTSGTLTISGVGAHLGLPRIANGIDLSAPADAPNSITYDIALLSEDGKNLTVQIESGSGWWQYKYVKVGSTVPDVGGSTAGPGPDGDTDSSPYAAWSAFDGATKDGDTYAWPTGSQDWAGFENTNAALVPYNFQYGGTITFTGAVPSGGSDVPVGFTFERSKYPEHEPLFDSDNVTVSGEAEQTYTITIAARPADQTYSSILMKLKERDKSVIIKDVLIVASPDPSGGSDSGTGDAGTDGDSSSDSDEENTSSSPYAAWSAFDGATKDGDTYAWPTGSQDWAGFENTNAALVPYNFQYGGTITFTGAVPSGGSDVPVGFTFERSKYPEHEPLFDSDNVTVSGEAEQTYTITIAARPADQTYSSILMKLKERDKSVIIKDVLIVASPAPSDTTAPVITLIGDATVSVEQGSTYTDAGATADTGETVTIDASAVDTSTIGSYTVTFNVSDEDMNAAEEKTRTVNVVAVPVGTVSITKVIETNCTSPFIKVVELYVGGTVDFSDPNIVSVGYMLNGAAFADRQDYFDEIRALGKVTDRHVYLVRDLAMTQADFPSTTLTEGENAVTVTASTNGDDGYQVVMNGVVVSQFGADGQDADDSIGTSADWAHNDTYFERKPGSVDDGTFNIDHWNSQPEDYLDDYGVCARSTSDPKTETLETVITLGNYTGSSTDGGTDSGSDGGAVAEVFPYRVNMDFDDVSGPSTQWALEGDGSACSSFPTEGGNTGGYWSCNSDGDNGGASGWVLISQSPAELSTLGLSAGYIYNVTMDSKIFSTAAGQSAGVVGLKVEIYNEDVGLTYNDRLTDTGDMRVAVVGDGSAWSNYSFQYTIPASVSKDGVDRVPTHVKYVVLWNDHNHIGVDNIVIDATGTEPAVLAVPTESAAAPTADASSVLSIFSDTYTSIDGANFNPNWNQATVQSTETLADGGNVLKYESLNYQGMEFAAQDVSGYTHVHLDFWTPNATTLRFSLIESVGGEHPFELTVTNEEWVSVDIPLSHYTTGNSSLDLTDVFQFKTDADPDGGSPTVYLDNIYFHGTVSTEPTSAITVLPDVVYDAATPNRVKEGVTVKGYVDAGGLRWVRPPISGEAPGATYGTGGGSDDVNIGTLSFRKMRIKLAVALPARFALDTTGQTFTHTGNWTATEDAHTYCASLNGRLATAAEVKANLVPHLAAGTWDATFGWPRHRFDHYWTGTGARAYAIELWPGWTQGSTVADAVAAGYEGFEGNKRVYAADAAQVTAGVLAEGEPSDYVRLATTNYAGATNTETVVNDVDDVFAPENWANYYPLCVAPLE